MDYKEYVNNILNNIPLGIAITGIDGYVKNVNIQLLDMFGYKLAEVMGKPICNLFQHPDTVEKLLQKRRNIIEEEVYVKARTNKIRFNMSSYPIHGIDDKKIDMIYIFNDIKKERKLTNKIIDNKAIYTFDKIISKDKNFNRLIRFAKEVSDSKSTVLITGESGTGKEVFAQSIHNYSNRRDKSFVAINSGAIPKSLIESELFGYEEGAFTGAKKEGRLGKFEIAHGGTIFLDEIGEMPYDMQTRLLRVIEEGVVSRIGGLDQKVVDVRIIAASNRDLKEEVEKGNFRKDLFYRLNVLPIRIPPLKRRKEDIPLLIDYFMEKISNRLNKKKVLISEEKLDELMDYDWPGNVRELENFIELSINLGYIPNGKEDEEGLKLNGLKEYKYENLMLDYMEKRHIIKVLKIFSCNITKSAEALGIGRNTLYRKMDKYGIDCSDVEQWSVMERNI
ncbi:sigma-54 interaction domain-containing protein [Schnuerera sp.]|uniref:sigma-54 interaction domain-containing protein n=1 Tax=Schnuerera sp. TaxID=2794844 RepID=UPI002CB1C76A|nr:sigma 54-interacting transcriptional regulator [Schnuerera sp.]HSH36641.1 sigma 54-interacting transcriptional regulator [Schnuerera sp.]